MSTPKSPKEVLETIHGLNSNNEISILKLSEPISTDSTAQDPAHQRTSDVSNASLDAPTPASLEADLTHYRELFAKLRFSYVEQVTKEKFIRAIVGDPPLIVSTQENLDLERDNAVAKAELKALKNQVADMVTELEKKGRELAQRYENVKLKIMKLEELPKKIEGLEEKVEELRKTHAMSLDANPEMNLPLTKTVKLVESRKRRRQDVDRELARLLNQVPHRQRELERARNELQPLETKRQCCVASAKEAKKRKESANAGVEDDLEERGRWHRAVHLTLKHLIDAAAATRPNHTEA